MKDLTKKFDSHYANILQEFPDCKLYEMVTSIWNDFVFENLGSEMEEMLADIHLYEFWFTDLVKHHQPDNQDQILVHLADVVESVIRRHRLYFQMFPERFGSVKV